MCDLEKGRIRRRIGSRGAPTLLLPGMHRFALYARLAAVLAVFPCLTVACSSATNDEHGGDHDAGSGDSSPTPTSPTTDAGSTSDAAVAAPLVAPSISGIAKMAGGLHVSWKNAQKDCDKIEGERKSDTEPYKVAFSVPGVADNKHDAVGLASGTMYTYRLRCVKGDSVSDYSVEKTGTP